MHLVELETTTLVPGLLNAPLQLSTPLLPNLDRKAPGYCERATEFNKNPLDLPPSFSRTLPLRGCSSVQSLFLNNLQTFLAPCLYAHCSPVWNALHALLVFAVSLNYSFP